MAEMYAVPGETLTGIANAIRAKIGSDDYMPVSSMASAIEGITGGGGVIEFQFVRADMTDIAGRGNNQRVIQDFTNYWDSNKPVACGSGVWVFVPGNLRVPTMYMITTFVVIDGAVQVFYRNSYKIVDFPLSNTEPYAPDNTSVWCWGCYSDTTTYYGAKLF